MFTPPSSVTIRLPEGADAMAAPSEASANATCSGVGGSSVTVLRRLGLLLAFLAAIGCSPGPAPPPPGPPRVWDVSPGDLCRTAHAYAGRAVRVRLPAGSYSVWPFGVTRNPPAEGRPVALVFECRQPPKDNARDVVLTGVVYPVVPDGVWRMNGVNWETRVKDATVSHPGSRTDGSRTPAPPPAGRPSPPSP